jgi:hypothetical protein
MQIPRGNMKTFFAAIQIFIILSFPFTGYSSDTSSVKYMPLSVGNIWVYDYFTQSGFQYSTITRVTADTIINNRRYYKMSGSFFDGMYRTDTITGSLMKYGGPNSCNYYYQESLRDSLAIISGMYSCNILAAGSRLSNVTVLNSQTSAVSIQYGVGTSYSNFRYGKYIGLYTYSEYLFNTPVRTYNLRGARINNIVYGDTSGLTGIFPVSSYLAENFTLSQNYPNPFNPQTKIKFELPSLTPSKSSIPVKLAVYDMLGREVTTLINSELKPGTYEADWDGSDYSSGIYFYKLEAGDFTETKKMLMVK